MIKPRKPLNKYLKANWGDHIKMHEGHAFHITSTSSLIAIFLKLRDKQWDKIFAAVLASRRCKNLKKAMAASTPKSPQAALVVLQDDDSNLTDS